MYDSVERAWKQKWEQELREEANPIVFGKRY